MANYYGDMVRLEGGSVEPVHVKRMATPIRRGHWLTLTTLLRFSLARRPDRFGLTSQSDAA